MGIILKGIDETGGRKLERECSKKSEIIDRPIQVTDKTFDQIIEAHPAVVVDFWAQWCPPCRLIAPIIDELAKDYAGKVVFGKLNTDENQSTATKYNVMSVPNLLFFKKGKLVDQVIGAVPRQHIEQKIKKIIG